MNERNNGSKGGSPSETISRLQRGVLRLALSFHGQHTELDKRLKELGILIRGGRKDEELQRLIDEIVDTIVSQDLAQNTDQRGGRTLCDLLQRIESRFPHSRALQPIQRQLSLPLDSASFDRAVEDAADAVVAIASHKQDTQGRSAQTADTCNDAFSCLLDKIDFPGSAESEIAEIKDRIRRHQDDVERMRYVDRTAALISAELSRKGDSEQFANARDQLLLLMNLIPFPADLTERSSKTRRSVEKAETAAALYGCIPEIADLTATMRVQLQAEIDELGEFLKNTLDRLREFEAQIQQSNSFHDQSATNAFDLEQSMGKHVEGMRADIEDEMDIASIKAAVSSHLDNINEGLGEFVKTEHERHKEARERIDHMVGALNELEFEAKELRDSLEKQHEQVLIDPLTGILNRTGYHENINKEFVRWRRYNSSLSLAVIDLDLFKTINDTYGHAAGDKVLATVAQQIESQIRQCDILCRYGGEEFVLLLPETSVSDGKRLVEKLRNYISECNFHFQKTPVPVTMSCGVAEFHRDDSIEDVFDRADQAMYLAKRSGRDQCRSEDELREQSA